MNEPAVSRDASGRLAVEVFDIPMEMYRVLCQEIALAFGLSGERDSVTHGVDVVFMDFRPEFGVIEMAWDHWSGFMVTAKVPESEPLVRRIYEWLMDRTTRA